MADEAEIFDPSQKKKKGKKKPFDLSALEGNDADTGGDSTAHGAGEEGGQNDSKDDLPDELKEIQQLMKKKKSSKKKTFNLDEIENTLPDPESGTRGGADDGDQDKGTGEANDDAAANEDMDLDFGAKKKKKKKKVIFEDTDGAGLEKPDISENLDDAAPQVPSSQPDESAASGIDPNMPWLGSDRDYTYDELLQHVFNIIKQKNPDIVGEKKRLVMRPPQVLRVGTKKTSFANFLEICKLLHRQPKHMQAFLLAELGTSGSVDANNQLIIKGRFQQKQIENVLRRYIKEYVACQTCRSPETILQKDTRLFFLNCETCGSRRSVASIKSGYQAQVGKRAATRAKAN